MAAHLHSLPDSGVLRDLQHLLYLIEDMELCLCDADEERGLVSSMRWLSSKKRSDRYLWHQAYHFDKDQTYERSGWLDAPKAHKIQ